MHKSIPLLKDLAPSSENIIDSYTQLYPLRRPRPAQTKQHFIVCYSGIQISIFPPAGRAVTETCRQHPLTTASLLRTDAGNSKGSWRTGAEGSAQTHVKTSSRLLGSLHSCCVRGLQRELGAGHSEDSAAIAMHCRAEEKTDKPSLYKSMARAYRGHV